MVPYTIAIQLLLLTVVSKVKYERRKKSMNNKTKQNADVAKNR